jgi:hypothetical protein
LMVSVIVSLIALFTLSLIFITSASTNDWITYEI